MIECNKQIYIIIQHVAFKHLKEDTTDMDKQDKFDKVMNIFTYSSMAQRGRISKAANCTWSEHKHYMRLKFIYNTCTLYMYNRMFSGVRLGVSSLSVLNLSPSTFLCLLFSVCVLFHSQRKMQWIMVEAALLRYTYYSDIIIIAYITYAISHTLTFLSHTSLPPSLPPSLPLSLLSPQPATPDVGASLSVGGAALSAGRPIHPLQSIPMTLVCPRRCLCVCIC